MGSNNAIRQLAASGCEHPGDSLNCRDVNLPIDDSCWPCQALDHTLNHEHKLSWHPDFQGKTLEEMADTGLIEIARLRVQVADFKERADIADTIHREMMEKLERYRAVFAQLTKVAEKTEAGLVSGYYIRMLIKDALLAIK